MSLVYFNDCDNDGKLTQMQCENCQGILWNKTQDSELDPPMPLILISEYECIQCQKRSCLLKRNLQFPLIPQPFAL